MDVIELTHTDHKVYKGFNIGIYEDNVNKYAVRNSSPSFCISSPNNKDLKSKYEKVIDFYLDYVEGIAFT